MRFEVNGHMHAPAAATAPESKRSEPDAPQLLGHLTDLAAQVARLARLRAARARLNIRQAIAWAVAGMFALLVTSVSCVIGAVLFARGLAATFAVLAGERAWLGDLLAGAVLLVGTAAAGWFAWTVLDRRELRQQLEEHRRETHADP